MFKEVEISYIEVEKEKERLGMITEILSGGMYGYLKKSGLLRENLKQEEKIKKILREAKEISAQAEEEIEVRELPVIP